MTLQRPMFPPAADTSTRPAAQIDRRGVLCGLVAAASLPSPAAAGVPVGRPEPDPVFAVIEAYRDAETGFDQVEGWRAQVSYRDEIFWPRVVDLVSTPPVTLAGLAALLAVVRESGGVLDLVGEENLAYFDRSIERSVCALAGLPAPALSMRLQDIEGGEHAA